MSATVLRMIGESDAICVSESGRLITRTTDDFSDCLVCSCSVLSANKEFSFSLEKIDEKFSGSLEFGVVGYRDNQQQIFSVFDELPKITARDADILSGSTVISIDYFPKSLDLLEEETTLGFIISEDNTVSFTYNGVNLGPVGLPKSFESLKTDK